MRETLTISADLDGFANRYRAKPAGREHRHEELEFNLVVHGTCTYLVAERRYDLRRGSLIWLHPDQEHVLLNPSSDCEMWVVVVRQEALVRMTRVGLDRRLLERSPAWRILRALPSRETESLDRLIGGLQDAAPARRNVGVVHATHAAWDAFLAAADEGEGAAVDPAVDLAARLLTRDDAPGDLTELAIRVGLSPSRLSRKFHAQLGVGIADYRNRVRLERFLAVHGPGTTILDAALAAGFGSYPQFHRVFRQMLGVTPRSYLAGQTSPDTGQGPVRERSKTPPRRRTRRR